MRTVCRPPGSPTSVNDPVESLTSKVRTFGTAIITPEIGRPLMEERTVPVRRAVVSRCARAGVTRMPRISKEVNGARCMGPYERRCNLTEPHAIHRWEMLRDRLPAVPLVLTHPQRPRRRAEREPVPRLVHVERVAIGEIVGVLLRQSLREHLEAFAPIPGARHDDPALHRDALLVAHARHEPGGVRVVGMHRDREAEPRGLDRGDLLPRRRAVGGAEHAVVVLDPKGIGLGPTLD